MATRDEKAKLVADAVGVAHFLVANFCIIIGKFSAVFVPFVGRTSQDPGLEFVYKYLDYFVYGFLNMKKLTEAVHNELIFSFIAAEFIIILSSVIYGVVVYLFGRLVLSVIDR